MNPSDQTSQEGQWPLSLVELAKDWRGIERLAPHLATVELSLWPLGCISLTTGLAFGVQSTRLTSAPYILPREELYAFHDLMREMLAPYIRIHERDKWLMYHERARKYLAKRATRYGKAYPVDGYYHALAFNEKKGLEEWRHAVNKAYEDGNREMLAALFLGAYDKALDLSPTARAAIAYEQGRYYYTDQQWDEALKSTKRALDLYEKAGDAAGQARVCVGIANIQRFRPDCNLQAALIYYKQAYDLYLSLDDGGVGCYLNQARRLYEIGEVLRLQKKPDEALESYSEALKIFQAFGYHRDMAYVHRSMGDALVQLECEQGGKMDYEQFTS